MNENQLGVFMESLLDRVDAIAEGQRSMRENFEQRFDEINKRFEQVDKGLSDIKQDNKIIKAHLAAIEDGLNDHEKRITTLDEKVAI